MLSEEKLPKEYINAMKALLQEDYEYYIKSLNEKPYYGMRVNTLKIKEEELLNLLGLSLEKVRWSDSGFYIDEKSGLSKSPYYYAGLFYLQEPSAMSSAALLDINKNDKVLDLCAAPGGKSTALAAKLCETGVLVSNDLSASRAKALLKNIELFGIGNAIITCASPFELSQVYNNYFDKILVDAPCSGEGMFRKDIAVFNAYLKRGPEFFHPIQVDILNNAAKMLKCGGTLLYSTCTYSVKEDEDTIKEFLSSNPNFELTDIDFYEGFTSSMELPKAIRLFPHKLKGEGHFVCKLIKTNDGDADFSKNYYIAKKNLKLPKELLSFLENIDKDWDKSRFFINNEYIYYLPEDTYLDKSIHYLRTGLLLGRINHNRFEPSQALAMNLKIHEWKNPINLSINDERVLRYLKGETIEVDSIDAGYRLVCLDSHPLGFVKQEGQKCKNKYYKGWRIQ